MAFSFLKNIFFVLELFTFLCYADEKSAKAEEGLPTSDFRLPTSDFRLPTSKFKASIFGVQLISPDMESNLVLRIVA